MASLGLLISTMISSLRTEYSASYELRRCVRARTRAMCGHTCACEIYSGKCAGCARVRPFFGRAMCDHTFAHFLGQTCQKMLLFVLKKGFQNIFSCFGASFPVLDHLILFLNTLNHKNAEKLLKKVRKIDEKRLKCGCGCEVRPLKIGCAHTCACAP